MKARTWIDITLIVVAVAVGLALSMRPWDIYREQKRLTDRSVEAMKKAEAEQTELAKKRSSLESPWGREAYLREQGYHREDETPLTK